MNTVSCGVIRGTKFIDDHPEILASAARQTPLGSYPDTDEVAEAIACSPRPTRRATSPVEILGISAGAYMRHGLIGVLFDHFEDVFALDLGPVDLDHVLLHLGDERVDVVVANGDAAVAFHELRHRSSRSPRRPARLTCRERRNEGSRTVTTTLAGKVAVVTGASRGIGKQTCLALAELGASLVLASRTEEPRPRTPGTLNDTADAIRAAGGDALVVKTDLAEQADLERLISVDLERHGHVDILVNNAAYTVGKALWAHVPELTRESVGEGLRGQRHRAAHAHRGFLGVDAGERRWRRRERHLRCREPPAARRDHPPPGQHLARQRTALRRVEGGARPHGERDRP